MHYTSYVCRNRPTNKFRFTVPTTGPISNGDRAARLKAKSLAHNNVFESIAPSSRDGHHDD